jgi:hypothetical protein
MTTANCPSCGAPVRFRAAASVVAICEFCRSMLVRHGTNLEDVGRTMARPGPHFAWSGSRLRDGRRATRVHFAHSDASGFSRFEEAQYRGVAAAERVLAALGARTYRSL